MLHRFRILSLGFIISFLGSIPLGTMNIAATEISLRDGSRQAIIFSAGCMVIELLYVRFIVATLQWVEKNMQLFKMLGWLTVIILLAMAYGSLSAIAKSVQPGYALPSISSHHFLYGAALSAANPLHFVFWFGWSTILINKQLLIPSKSHYLFYMTGIGIGTIGGFLVFIFLGTSLIQSLHDRNYLVNGIIAIILIMTALLQFYKIMFQSSGSKQNI